MASSGLSLAERLGGSVPGGRVGRPKSSNSLRSQPYGASPRSSSASKFGDKPAGKRDLDAKWTHDMFASHNGIEGGELGARLQGNTGRQITGGAESSSRLVSRAFAGALGKPAAAAKQQNTTDSGLSIKGASSAHAGTGVEVEGLAPGTTSEDVAEIFSQCGTIVDHRLLTRPDASSIRVYLNFESPQGAQAAVSRFDKQTADGRTLHVFVVTAGTLASRLGVEQRKNPSRANVDLLGGNSSGTGGMRSDDLILNDPRAKVITDPSGINRLLQTSNTSSGGNSHRGDNRRGGRGRGRGRPTGPGRSLSARMDVD
ncbi:hypothetical protein FRB91_000712 [Serendipita sp. 411]|nr:hypothetical protein FRC18_008572 [Serendipita sp. 400]KAG8844510.1 hypothetical protein FRC20_003469 [Serendipita sp. 405]KAG8846521.1 hypothetical protein FRB91_000712 [Serendipita sp. 411]